jgi:hypothetical protein
MRILPILFLALGLFAALPVSAEVRILGSPGGEVSRWCANPESGS